MNAERWQQVRDVFEKVVELSPERRAECLLEVCPEDTELRSDVERILDSLEEAPRNFMEQPVAFPDPYEGFEIKPYRLVNRIGEGGMGVVYLAERADDAFEKRVAIKLLRPSGDSEELVRRFLAERRILARLEHPSIARILDGGTTSEGFPYLVMEYIEGVPIDEFCDSHHLTTRQRLELFCRVASAVHFAHQNLVVHRDLKPNNILVTDDGTPKLLDFGIAKLLSSEGWAERAQRTATANQRMTLAYASPEQVKNLPISTVSDVYSLGVVLFELLTGHSPYREGVSGSHADLVNAVCDTDPRTPSDAVATSEPAGKYREAEPSKLRRRLVGDIDNIVLMALRKEPRRRYASVEQMADDVRRHLEERPIQARESTLSYRLTKFVVRNRWSVTAAAAFVVAVLVFGTVMAVQREWIALERDRAEFVTNFVVGLFNASNPYAASEEAGGDVTARDLLRLGTTKLSAGLDDQPELESTLRATVGSIYQRMGLYEESGPLLEAALTTRQELLGRNHPLVAKSLYDLGLQRMAEGQYEDASRLLEDALTIQRRKLKDPHIDLASTLNVLGALRLEEGDHDVADALLTEALEMRRELYTDDHPDVAKSLNDLALLRQATGRYGEAESLFQEALSVRRRLLPSSHPDLAESLNNLANLFLTLQEYGKAEPMLRQALEIYRQELGDNHPYVVIALTNLASTLLQSGDLDGAEPLFRDVLELHRELVGPNHPYVATTMSNLARLLAAKGELAEAEGLDRDALASRRSFFGAEHADVAESMDNLGFLLFQKGDVEEAQEKLLYGLDLRRKLLGERHLKTGVSLNHLALFYSSQGDPMQAEQMARKATAIFRETFGPENWRVKEAESVLGDCLADLARFDEAEGLLRDSYESLREQKGPDARPTRNALERLNQLYEASGRRRENGSEARPPLAGQ